MADQYKYNPRLTPGIEPGDPITVDVDLPDDATDEDHFEAMMEAAKFLGIDTE